MSIIKSLQDWLSEFDGMEIRPLSEIQTDRTEDSISSYAMAAAGNTSRRDVCGGYMYQHSYVFYAKEAAADEIDRQDNHDFLESLSEWMEARVSSGLLPSLPGRYEVEDIEVSNGMLMDLYDDGTGLYQLQVQLKFSKRSV